ncbi:hypothetical protein ABYF34_06185 [Buchananella felis]|uniref:hypothetical protein n=1 Tax=Buchananella felis TaxID=3231492 RepID=UPI0035272EDB
MWPQVLITVEEGERAESWMDRPLPSQDDELLLRERYVAGRGEIESPGERAGEGTGQGAGEALGRVLARAGALR